MTGADRSLRTATPRDRHLSLAVLARHAIRCHRRADVDRRRDPDGRRSTEGSLWRSRFPARNPAFDVTPAELITAIITEEGVHRAPFADSLAGASAVT